MSSQAGMWGAPLSRQWEWRHASETIEGRGDGAVSSVAERPLQRKRALPVMQTDWKTPTSFFPLLSFSCHEHSLGILPKFKV